jgi:hypothetical protein
LFLLTFPFFSHFSLHYTQVCIFRLHTISAHKIREPAMNLCTVSTSSQIQTRKGADKSSAFPFAAKPKDFFLHGLKKLQQRSHMCVELSGEYVE